MTASQANVWTGSMPSSTRVLCTELSHSGQLLYRTNHSGTGGVQAAIDNRSGMVYLARRNIPCAAVDVTEANITRGLGPDRHSREVPRTPTEANVDAEYAHDNRHGNMV